MAVSTTDADSYREWHEVITMQTIDPPTTRNDIRPSAVTWIDDAHAMVATISAAGQVTIEEIHPRHAQAAPDETYLARVVDAIGDRERVAIVGPGQERLALEREYVLIYRTPDRLVDVEPATESDRDDLISRLYVLSLT